MRKLDPQIARRLTLDCQGLLKPDSFGRGKAGALRALEHLGYVQIDTIAVIERAHHHVLWSRVEDYRPWMLDELQSRDRGVFEYWSHAASYLPMRDYRYSLPMMREVRIGKRFSYHGRPGPEIRQVLGRIRREGALRLLDFEGKGEKAHLWASAKPAKRALEQLLYEGRLMITGRQGFQKLYDLTERVLPPAVDRTMPSPRERIEHLVERVIRAHGFATAGEIHYLNNHFKDQVRKVLARRVRSGELAEVEIEGVGRTFIDVSHLEDVERHAAEVEPVFHILSPFDNLVIQRKRLKALFGFDYLIECYVPEPKRKYGYFVLPLLHGTEFVGRIDAKADRARRTLLVHKVWFESSVKPPRKRSLLRALDAKLQKFAEFNGCETFERPR